VGIIYLSVLVCNLYLTNDHPLWMTSKLCIIIMPVIINNPLVSLPRVIVILFHRGAMKMTNAQAM
jgi:hypothetical protein